jgi:hypothetical protein
MKYKRKGMNKISKKTKWFSTDQITKEEEESIKKDLCKEDKLSHESLFYTNIDTDKS